MPTPFARQTEQALLQITFGQHGAAWESREYKLAHSDKRRTRRMLREEAQS